MAPWSPTTPWIRDGKKTQAVWPTYVCRNPQCKSYGKSHPNCQCGAPGTSTDRSFSRAENQYSEGGMVSYCSHLRAHQPECEYYSEGGAVHPQAAQLDDGSKDDLKSTLEHSVVEHELVGLLEGKMGMSRLQDPEKHTKIIDEAKAQYRHRGLPPPADGLPETPLEKTSGTKLGDRIFEGDQHEAANLLHGHALTGDTPKTHLEPILKRLAKPMLEQDTHPGALRAAIDFLDSSARGNNKIKEHVKGIFEKPKHPSHMQEMSREASRNDLQEKIHEMTANPSKMLEMSGSVGHYLPDAPIHMGSTATIAIQYLNAIKPKRLPSQPLDGQQPIDPIAQDTYHRQLDIANQPTRVLEHVRNGTLQPEDVATLKTIYPSLYQNMVSQVGEELINAQHMEKEISYPQAISLSMLLGQPLDSTMTADSMQAIISSAQKSAQGQSSKNHGPTAETMKTINKVDSLYDLPDQKRQIERKA